MVVRELLIALAFRANPRPIQQIEAELDDLERSALQAQRGLSGMASTIAGLGVGAALAGIGTAMIGTINEFQRLDAQLQTIEGSATKAEAAFAMLQEFAKTTPFQLNDVVDSFAKLRAVGLAPTTQDLTAIGNVAAGMGKDIIQFTEAVTDATTGEMERLKEFGILASQQGDSVEFTFRGVKTKMKKDSKEIFSYLTGLGNAEFAGGMERQAKTVAGSFSNLMDNISSFFNEVGKAGLSDALNEIIQLMTGIASSSDDTAKSLGKTLAKSIRSVIKLIELIRDNAKELKIILGSIITVFALYQLGAFVTALGAMNGMLIVTKLVALKAAASITLLGAKWAIIAIAVLGTLLAVEDFIGFLQGKESVIGQFLEDVYGIKGPIPFIEKLEELRPVLLGILAIIAGAALIIGAPFIAIAALLAIIVASIIIVYQELRDNWTLLSNHFKEVWEDLKKSMKEPFLPLIAAMDDLGKKWGALMGSLTERWERFKQMFSGGIDKVMRLAERARSLIPFGNNSQQVAANAIGGGAVSPARDIATRANTFSTNSNRTSIANSVPITINVPPGESAEQTGLGLGSIIRGLFDSTAANYEGGVD